MVARVAADRLDFSLIFLVVSTKKEEHQVSRKKK